MTAPTDSRITSRLRSFVLILAALAAVATPVELIFAEHYEGPSMLIPFVLTGLALLAMLGVVLWPSVRVFRVFRLVMVLLFVGSALERVMNFRSWS